MHMGFGGLEVGAVIGQGVAVYTFDMVTQDICIRRV